MKGRLSAIIVLFLGVTSQDAAPPSDWISDNVLFARLEQVFKDSKTPGAVGAIVRLGEPTRIGAFGVRRAGHDEAMTPADLVHIGSDTKAMTAVLIARLVQAKKLRWDSTVAEVLPSMARKLHADFRGVTVRQLMLHRGGLPANPANWFAFPSKEIHDRRLRIAKAAMSSKPVAQPGEKFIYSNLGIMIAGVMAEAATDATWEELMQRELFEPLGMQTASFGIPGTIGKADQPWGHTERSEGGFTPVQIDNDPALGPAGTVHLSMADWAKFVAVFLRPQEEPGEEPGEGDPFLTEESMAVLRGAGAGNDPTPGWGMGWMLVDRPWAGGTALTHTGSNTTWFANAWVAPEVGVAFLVAVNAVGSDVPSQADEFIGMCVLAKSDKKGR